MLSVPADGLEQAVDDSLAAGARALVAIAAGFAEVGEEGAARERALVERVRAAGAALVGPNCLGLFDGAAELQLASTPLPAGPIGFVSQSGNVMLEVALLLEDVELGFSRAVSIGNQADLGATELVAALGEHDGTRVIGVYCEDFLDGRAFVEAARTAGKPVVLLTVGRTEAGRRAARSHTGALTSGRRSGRGRVPRRRDPPRRDAAGARRRRAGAARAAPAPRAGASPWSATAAATARSRATCSARAASSCPCSRSAPRRRCASTLPANASTANPVDLAGAGEQDVFSFAHTTRALLEDDGVDAVLFTAYFGGYSTLADELGEPELAAAELLGAGAWRRAGSRSSSTRCTGTRRRRARCGRPASPVYRAIESAVDAIAALVADGAPVPPPLPSLPAPAAPLTGQRLRGGAGGARGGRHSVRRGPDGREPGRGARGRPPSSATRSCSRRSALLHKSDAGGVALGLRDEQELGAAFDDLAARLDSGGVLASRPQRTWRPASSCSSALGATRASGRSSWSPRAGSRPSSPATSRSRSRRSTWPRPRSSSARSARRRCCSAPAAARGSTSRPPHGPSPRCRASLPRIPRSQRSRSTRCS